MLTIITGAPGAGKTCAMVSLMMGELAGRPLYADGVNGLTIEHTPVDLNEWHITVPKGIGAVVCGDEGQRRWRPRGPGQKVPPAIEAMETHRHDGLDFFITTQSPNLLDSNIRNLCGRHVHIRDLGLLGRWWYEWPECSDNPKQSWRTAPIKKKYKLDKKAFGLYKSASLHIKPVRSVPWMVLVLAAAVIGVGVLSFMTWRTIKDRLQGVPVAATAAPAKSAASGSPGPQAAPAGPMRAYLTDANQFRPRVTSNPETAPAYDELRRVVTMPRVVGGWCRGDECRCITQQGTDAGMTWRDCRSWLESPPFNPYTLPEVVRASNAQGEPSSTSSKAPSS
jgi:zona occludens toxin